MGYELKGNEVGIILRPFVDDAGVWTGELDTGLAINLDEATLSEADMAHLVHVATMMTAFLSYMNDHDEILDEIEELRNTLMGIDSEDYYDDKEEDDVTKEGNVITINKWTKTHGSA